MTIMSDGERQCDARCYDAKGLGCDCVCGGKNHGLGIKHALKEAGFDIHDPKAERPLKVDPCVGCTLVSEDEEECEVCVHGPNAPEEDEE